MKILCVIGSMGVGGGAERVMSCLASYLSSNHEVTWLSLFHHDGPTYPTNPGVKRINGLDHKNKIDLVRRLRQYIKKESPDIVLSFLTQINISTLLATVFTRTKVVVSDRGNLAVRNKLRKYLRLVLYPHAAGRVFQTNEAKNYFSGKIREDSVVIPNPIFINPSLLRSHNFPRRKEIVSVGRLDFQKNHELTIKAFANIYSSISDYKLLIFGEGNDRSTLEKLITQLNMQDKILLCGRVPNVLERIQDAQLFIMSSRWEGMPNALMEAMALGLPCISTDCPVGGPRELITPGENGFLFDNENQSQLEALMLKLLSDLSLADRIGERARDIMLSYNADRICSTWESYLMECASK